MVGSRVTESPKTHVVLHLITVAAAVLLIQDVAGLGQVIDDAIVITPAAGRPGPGTRAQLTPSRADN